MADDLAAQPARLAHACRAARAGRQRLRRLQPPLAEDALGGLRHRDEDAADRAGLLPNRAVGEDEVALLGEAVTVQRQHEIDERRRRPLHDAREHRADDVPDLGERLARAGAHRARVLRRPEDGAVAVVVELCVFRSPRDVHREAGLEQDAERGAQALRPCRHRPDGGPRPVDGPHERTHLTAAA